LGSFWRKRQTIH